MSELSGTVLWYQPTIGRGMVKSDKGLRMFFTDAAAVEPVAGLRIVFVVDKPTAGGPAVATRLGLENDVRNVLDPSEYLPQPKTKAKKKKAPAKKKAAAKKPRAKKKTGVAAPLPSKAPGAAMAAGAPVSHPDFGAGHVVSSTKTLVRVEFLSGEERSLPFSEVEDVGGKGAKAAPKRRKSAAAAKKAPAKKAPAKKAPAEEPSPVDRKKSDDA